MVTRPTFKLPDDDPHKNDLRLIANETVVPENILQQCPALLALVPERLIAKERPTYERAGVLRNSMYQVMDRAFAKVVTDDRDVRAHMVLAAGALVGLVTESPQGYTTQPSKMTRAATTGSKETRQMLAGEWLNPPITSGRGVRSREDECLNAFRHALIQFFSEGAGDRGRGTTVAPALEVASFDPAGTTGSSPKGAELEVSRTGRQPGRRRVLVGVGIVVGVMATGAGIGIGVALDHSANQAAPPNTTTNQPVTTSNNGPVTTVTGSASPLVSGKIYTEQEGHLGTYVYSDPTNLSAVGRLQPLQKVQVSCKVLDPSMGSVSPDGYWYRIVGGQWNNDYAIANTFFNGDPIVGTSNATQHFTDFNVQDCPASS